MHVMSSTEDPTLLKLFLVEVANTLEEIGALQSAIRGVQNGISIERSETGDAWFWRITQDEFHIENIWTDEEESISLQDFVPSWTVMPGCWPRPQPKPVGSSPDCAGVDVRRFLESTGKLQLVSRQAHERRVTDGRISVGAADQLR